MKIRTLVIFAITVVIVVTAVNFLLDNFRLMNRLPENRVEQARREALQKPFYEREHRLERQPRLESGHAQRADGSQIVAADIGGNDGQMLSDLARERDRKESSQQLRGARGTHTIESKPIESVHRHARDKYHVIPSVDGGIYTEWQIRVCYYWYLQMKQQHPNSAMGGFTRLLHSGKSDHLMSEIPTVVVDPLPPGMDQGYPVLNRPFAFLQWVNKYMDDIPEDYIFMAEPDHIFVVPPPLWATPSKAAAYPFSYIQPGQHVALIERFNKKKASITAMAPIGNSPVQIHKDQLRAIVENWYSLSLRFKQDPAADRAFGWILDMYAYSIASSQLDTGPVQYDLHQELMAQPPFDPFLEIQGKAVNIVHLTYGMDYSKDGKMVYGQRGDWHFDKRDYSKSYPPRQFPPLPPEINAPAIKYIMEALNEAFRNITWPVTQTLTVSQLV